MIYRHLGSSSTAQNVYDAFTKTVNCIELFMGHSCVDFVLMMAYGKKKLIYVSLLFYKQNRGTWMDTVFQMQRQF